MKKNSNMLHYCLMLSPGIILLFIYSIMPLFGIVIAFQDFIPTKGILHSKWVGLENFTYMFQLPDSKQILFNTIYIATMKIIMKLLVSLAFALMLHEVRIKWAKRLTQTIVYLPHFLSWVILAGILTDMLSSNGIINNFFNKFTDESIFFLASNKWFPVVLISSDVWKEFGFNAIVFLAALAAVNPNLYEASDIDGANRFQKLIYVTIPGIAPTIVLLACLGIGQVLNAGFEQVFNLYNPLVYESGDIIDTYVYRVGLIQHQYGLATAVGTLKSVVGFILIILSYKLADKFANYRIF